MIERGLRGAMHCMQALTMMENGVNACNSDRDLRVFDIFEMLRQSI